MRDVIEALKEIKSKAWRTTTQDGDEWTEIVRQALVHQELLMPEREGERERNFVSLVVSISDY